jgi:hypothetical protein
MVTDENPIAPPPWLNAPPVDPYPFVETYDLREGPDLHPALQPLLPYIGLWRGRGRGGFPTIEDFDYGQEIKITHDGRPFLYYESRAWVINEENLPVRPAGRESGWWRPVLVDGRATGELEVLITTPTGIMEMHIGKIDGTRVEMATDLVLRTPTAKEVTAGHRLYGIVEGALLYAHEVSIDKSELQPHMSARLLRVGG